jgi:hypothetical protein
MSVTDIRDHDTCSYAGPDDGRITLPDLVRPVLNGTSPVMFAPAVSRDTFGT